MCFFLYWLGINYRQVFEQLMSRMLGISGVWPQGWTLKREYYHLDLCVTFTPKTQERPTRAVLLLESVLSSL